MGREREKERMLMMVYIYKYINLIKLFYTEFSLTIIVFTYIQYKNIFSQSFYTPGLFIMSCNINSFRVNVRMLFKILLNIISNWSMNRFSYCGSAWPQTFRAPELEPHQWMQFSVLPTASIMGEGLIPQRKIQSAYSWLRRPTGCRLVF